MIVKFYPLSMDRINKAGRLQSQLLCFIQKAELPSEASIPQEKSYQGPYIGPRGGKWADPEHTIPWRSRKGGTTPATRRLSQIPPLYLDTKTNQWVRTRRPDQHYLGAHEMPLEQFQSHWSSGKYAKVAGEEGRNPISVHVESVHTAALHGLDLDPSRISEYGVGGHEIPYNPNRVGAGSSWWKHFGFSEPLAWDGVWKDTKCDNPKRYNIRAVKKASKRILKLRELRSKGAVPKEVVEAIVLFAIASRKTHTQTHERCWPIIDQWLEKSPNERTDEELLAALRPLGFQNERLRVWKMAKDGINLVMEGMKHFPDHGPTFRDWLTRQSAFEGLGQAKTSFILQLLGYSDIACVDSRLIKEMTGPTDSRTVSRIAHKFEDHPRFYAAFERHLKESLAYRETDPEPIQLGMAQWRMWNAQGGTDTHHQALWDSVARITGVKDFRKAIQEQAGKLVSVTPSLISALLEYCYSTMGAGPVMIDTIPYMTDAFIGDAE